MNDSDIALIDRLRSELTRLRAERDRLFHWCVDDFVEGIEKGVGHAVGCAMMTLTGSLGLCDATPEAVAALAEHDARATGKETP